MGVKVYELGASLTITDVENHKEQDYRWLEIPRVSDQGRCTILPQGGKLEVINEHGDISLWKSQELPAHERRMVRVLRVMSTIDPLKHELKEQLAALYTSILTFNPPGLDGRSDIHPTWDDTPLALKTMSRVVARCGTHVHGVSAEYADGSKSNRHGQENNPHVFSLSCGEYISDVVVCENPWDTHAIQLVTTRGRFSPFYGGNYGGLKILSSDDGVLAGFAGRMTKSGKVDIVARIQVAWLPFGAMTFLERLALQKDELSISEDVTESSLPTGLLIQLPTQHTSHASTFNVEIQFAAYSDHGVVVSQAPYRGKLEGERHSFELAPDEYIVAVSGNQSDRLIVSLYFFTNKGGCFEVNKQIGDENRE
ncbi:hypothetical protein FRC12_002798 [Ceratobasidium sp. 428]|nr:hypothetical protein FRC12_002798 [Ceratobasidium sp. 428]